MNIVKKKKLKKNFNSTHEDKIRELIQIVEETGIKVRREELKKGLGWKAVSGKCRVMDKKVVFIDRGLPQLEQIEFLKQVLDFF